jgi:hypothetical protein
LRGFGLLALDLLAELSLAAAQALGDLVQRAPPLGRVTLEVGRDRRCDLVDRAVELLADLRDARSVLVERALQTLGLVGDLGLDRGHELLLPGADTLQLGRQALLQARDLRAPVGEALLDGPLDLGERGAELRGRVRSRSATSRRRSSTMRRSSSARADAACDLASASACWSSSARRSDSAETTASNRALPRSISSSRLFEASRVRRSATKAAAAAVHAARAARIETMRATVTGLG